MSLSPTHLALAVELHETAGYHWILLDGSMSPHEYERLMEGGQSFASYRDAFHAGLAALLKLMPEDEVPSAMTDRGGFSAPR